MSSQTGPTQGPMQLPATEVATGGPLSAAEENRKQEDGTQNKNAGIADKRRGAKRAGGQQLWGRGDG